MEYSNLVEPDDVDGNPYIFVSYSRKDMSYVQMVLETLKENHFRFWYDKGLKSGLEWAEELGERIDQCDQFLVLISSNSVESKYVRKEIGMAIEKDKNILIVYLEETVLSSGLQLLLGNIQAINRSLFVNYSDFEKTLCGSLSSSTLYQSPETASKKSLSDVAESRLSESYSLITQIGAGGLGKVYLAVHNRTGAKVAVKLCQLDKSYRGSVAKATFSAEKTILLKLMQKMCPFTPTIFDWFEDDEQLFIVESLIDGESLESNTPLSEEEVVSIAKKVLKILKYLHDNNIIYRDIKPRNLIQDSYGEIHLIDFNTAMITENGSGKADILIGTMGFAPPEQYDSNGIINYSTDIYALGKTMVYLLCPEHFDRNATIPIRYYRKDVSLQLESVIEKMTAHFQEDRYQSVEELLNVLESYKRISLWKRIMLWTKSRREIKSYVAKSHKSAEERKRILQEMAGDSGSTNLLSESDGNTVFLSDSDEDV